MIFYNIGLKQRKIFLPQRIKNKEMMIFICNKRYSYTYINTFFRPESKKAAVRRDYPPVDFKFIL